jgi:hypothetical protein
MQKQNSKNKLLAFGFLAAVIASIAFIAATGRIKMALDKESMILRRQV